LPPGGIKSSLVSNLIGYDRYEGVEAWRALMQLYEVLRLYLNFFQPSMKLLSKKRDGARVSKRYDRAQTPCQRLLASTTVGKRDKERLRRLFRDLDPLALLKELEYRQDQFWQYANSPAQQVANSRISRTWTIPPSNAEQGDEVYLDTQVLDAIAAQRSPEPHGRGGLERILLRKSGRSSGCGLRSTRPRRPRPFFRTCSVATRDAFRRDSCGPCRDGFAIGKGSNCTVQRWIVSSRLWRRCLSSRWA